MYSLTKRNHHLVVVSVLAIATYFFLLYILGLEIADDLMFSSVDAKSYKEVAHWILSGEKTPYTAVRPVLYPFLLLVSTSLGGVKGLWLLQFFLWVCSVLVLFMSVLRLTDRIALAYIAVIIFISNLSLIALTLHALTEITTVFFLSCLAYHIAAHKEQLFTMRSIHRMLLIIGLLTLLRPMFFYPWLVLACLSIILRFNVYLNVKFKILWLLLCMSPIFLQLAIVKSQHDRWTISTRSADTIDFYLMAQCIQHDGQVELDSARAIVASMDRNQRLDYKIDHAKSMMYFFFTNVQENIQATSSQLYRTTQSDANLNEYVLTTNYITFRLHLVLLIFLLDFSWLAIIRRNWETLTVASVLVLLSLFYILASGVSFWQGDRLVVPAIALWLPGYLFVINRYVNGVYQRVKNRRRRKALRAVKMQ